MGNPDLGAAGTNSMAISQSIDYSKFETFSNVADEISLKTPPKLSCIWSAGCSYWLIWFWIFNKSCWKKMPDRRLNSYTGNWDY